jgi:sugar phosphate isomerase/epimerase
MAELGFISAEFPYGTLAETLDVMAQAGATTVQLDLVSATGHSFPSKMSELVASSIRKSFADRGLTLAALSGTYNMIHPDRTKRDAGARDLARLIEMAPSVGAAVVTLCTGTRDPENMWRASPENDSPDAWGDLLDQLDKALKLADQHSVTLGVEPEIANTINSVEKARRLLDEIRSPNLKIIMDGANIFQKGQLPLMRDVLERAFDLLGSDIVLAHAKDLDRDGDAGHLAPGRGKLDYPYYLSLLQRVGFSGSIILHSLKPAEAQDRLGFVRQSAPQGYLASRPPRGDAA